MGAHLEDLKKILMVKELGDRMNVRNERDHLWVKE
jgi:hypothetical protein